LLEKFGEITKQHAITIYGEQYGGSCQKMGATYGPNAKFIAFDVAFGDNWLDVPNAEQICQRVGLEFVYYKKIPTTLEAIDAERDADSEQAIRNGMGLGKKREGVVLRPLIEVGKNSGKRIIVKHKREEFRETLSVRQVVDPTKALAQRKGQEVADEYVVPERLSHVLDKLPECTGIEHTGTVIKAMLEDVKREAGDEIEWSKDAEKAITVKTAQMYKSLVKARLEEHRETPVSHVAYREEIPRYEDGSPLRSWLKDDYIG
jgi:hypothetical protein